MKAKKKSITIASSNSGKIKEFSFFLSEFPLNILPLPNGLNIDETGKTFLENAKLKAISVSCYTNNWVLADDSGLMVDALGGSPGILSARYANSDEERIKKILNNLGNNTNRSASFISAICIAFKGDVLLEVEGSCEGTITFAPRGQDGFGYDPIFQPNGQELTFAEMNKETKQSLGHRGKAFKLLKPNLRKILVNI